MLKTLMKIRLQGILLKQTKSSKKKNSLLKMVLFGLLLLYVGVVFSVLFGMLFSTLVEPFHLMGIDWLYFALMAIIIIMLCFIGSVFLTHHEIYEAKDNELLLSMPIKNRDILLSRVFSILVLNYIYEILVAGPAFYVYITTCGMSIVQIIMFIIMFITLPLFVLALSCLFGWILAQILTKVRMKNAIIIILYIAFMGAYFYVVTSIEQYIGWLIAHGETIAQAIERGLFPLYHLSIALQDENMMSFLIYLLSVLIPFAIVIYILSIRFVKLATTKPIMKKVKYVAKPMKTNSIKKALLKRELKHFTSNAMVMLNGSVGILFCIIGAIFMIIYKEDIQEFLILLPLFSEDLTPLLCLAGIGVSSMNIISASSISLEGNRLWILKSLPVYTKDIIHSKIMLHLLFCVPGGVVFSLASAYAFETDLFATLLIVLAPILFTLFIDLLGLILNLWKPKFDWVNETVCVKQSMPVILTMFISMGFAFVIALVYAFAFSDMISMNLYMYMVFGVFIVMNIILFCALDTWGVKRFEEL